MVSNDTCERCGATIGEDDPHVWLEVQSTNLGYDPIDTTQLFCADCYAAYKTFLAN